jgi:hypothetical protein
MHLLLKVLVFLCHAQSFSAFLRFSSVYSVLNLLTPRNRLRVHAGGKPRVAVLLQTQQFCRVFAQDGALVGFAQAGNTEHGIDFARIAHERIGNVVGKIRP